MCMFGMNGEKNNYNFMVLSCNKSFSDKLNFAGTPANRTQLPVYGGDNGFEDREGHQPPNHSHKVMNVLVL